MTNQSLNRTIIQEIGLTLDSKNRIVDQDSRQLLRFKNKNIKYSSNDDVYIGKYDIEFKPLETKNLMSGLFSHFTSKIEEETGQYVSMYYEKKDENNKSLLEVIVNGEKMVSDSYTNDALKYVDIIMQLNESDTSILKQYDKE